MAPYRIVLLGAGGVGKSALTIRHCHGTFVDRYDPTIEDTYKTTMLVDGRQCAVDIMDTAGTEQFVALHSLYMNSGDGFLLVFAVNSIESIKELQGVRDTLLRQKEMLGVSKKHVPLVLVANKCDLHSERTITREVGIALSKHWGGVPYYETSARRGINVDNAFQDVVRQVIKEKALEEAERSGSNLVNGREKKKKRGTGGCVLM